MINPLADTKQIPYAIRCPKDILSFEKSVPLSMLGVFKLLASHSL